MVDYISSSSGEIIGNNAIKQNQELLGIESNNKKNPYAQQAKELIDETDVSAKALEMYEQEQEYKKLRGFLLDSFSNDLSTSELVSLINQGKYEIPSDKLADMLAGNDNFLSDIFAPEPEEQ